MTIIIRFVDEGGFFRERYFEIVSVKDTTSLNLKKHICLVLSANKLQVQNIRGQGYDGASNMRGYGMLDHDVKLEGNIMKALIMAKRMISILLLRLLALGATISATIVTMTTHDSRNVLNLTFKATYTNAPTLRYFVVANAIASGYSIIVLFIPSKNLLWKFILISDLIVTSMLVSAISAALGVAQVGKKGNAHAGWLPICDQVPKFCDRLTGALIAGFIAPILYLLLVLFSIHNLINLLSVKP
ncbi:hypothetical protein AgCh_028087 [Apium graveolens]